MVSLFSHHFMEWVIIACSEWGYSEPKEEFYEKANKRLPEGVRTLLGVGIEEGIIIAQGHKFLLKGLSPNKGPYSWFSRYSSAQEPSLNWEYYIQVALYTQLYFTAESKGLTLTFEDDLMDLALYDKNKLVVCIEVKEKADQIQELIAGIKKYQNEVDFISPDRSNDPLRKAKYIVNKRPEYFCGIAIGARYDYKVIFPDDYAFKFEKDLIPWM